MAFENLIGCEDMIENAFHHNEEIKAKRATDMVRNLEWLGIKLLLDQLDDDRLTSFIMWDYEAFWDANPEYTSNFRGIVQERIRKDRGSIIRLMRNHHQSGSRRMREAVDSFIRGTGTVCFATERYPCSAPCPLAHLCKNIPASFRSLGALEFEPIEPRNNDRSERDRVFHTICAYGAKLERELREIDDKEFEKHFRNALRDMNKELLQRHYGSHATADLDAAERRGYPVYTGIPNVVLTTTKNPDPSEVHKLTQADKLQASDDQHRVFGFRTDGQEGGIISLGWPSREQKIKAIRQLQKELDDEKNRVVGKPSDLYDWVRRPLGGK